MKKIRWTLLKRLHQCSQTSHLNDLNNFNNYLYIDKINSQLERADIQKRILIRNIYREYEYYLNLIRDLVYISVEKGLNQIYTNQSIDEDFLNENDLFDLLEKKISNLINFKLPFITIEQLIINKIQENLNQEVEFNSLGRSLITKDHEKEQFQYEDGFQIKGNFNYQISEDFSNTSEYYQTETHDKFLSLDLDNNDHINYLSKNNNIENIGVEKKFISSILELIEDGKFEKTRKIEKQNLKNMDTVSQEMQRFLAVVM